MLYFPGPLHVVPGLPAVRAPARQVPAAHHEPAPRARVPAEHRLQADHQEGRRAGQGTGTLFSAVAWFHGIDVIFLTIHDYYIIAF